ncbi:hypothetical protein MHH70_01750 [Metasolibacillus sp. FSL H7-0170]|uniref:hypothetical protein n=1 Tax=Metasolibacillus sp. FSL H7-0170 TaxID=2921431 RepID=UPI0031599403
MSTFIQRIVDTLDEQADWNVTTTVSRKDLMQLVEAYRHLYEQQQVKQVVEKQTTEIKIGDVVVVQHADRQWTREIADIYTSELGEPNFYRMQGSSSLYTEDEFTLTKVKKRQVADLER